MRSKFETRPKPRRREEPTEAVRKARDGGPDHDRWIREQVKVGLDQLERGESVDDDEVRARVDQIFVEPMPQPGAETHMLEDVERILALSPEERLLEARNLSRLETSARLVSDSRDGDVVRSSAKRRR